MIKSIFLINSHGFGVLSREPCSSSPSWSARASQSKRFLNHGKAEVSLIIFYYDPTGNFWHCHHYLYCHHGDHQDSLDLELGASASRVAPHPPTHRRRSSGCLLMLMLIPIEKALLLMLCLHIRALWSNFKETMSKPLTVLSFHHRSAKRHQQCTFKSTYCWQWQVTILGSRTSLHWAEDEQE